MFSGYSCHSTCSLALQQNYRLHRSIYICFRSWFGRLCICISHESISVKSQTVCSQWSSWSRVRPKHDVWISYRCFVGILEWLSQISLFFSKRINNCRLVKSSDITFLWQRIAIFVFALTQQQNDLVKSLSAPTITATKNEKLLSRIEVGRLG